MMPRHDWAKLQEGFDLYKIEHKNKTLKDFCKLKKLNYKTARTKLRLQKSKKKANVFDRLINDSFVESIEEQPNEEIEKKALTYTEKIGMLDKIITLADDFIEEIRVNKKKPFKNITEVTKAFALAIKLQVDLMKIEIDKRTQSEDVRKELIIEEENFFEEMLNAKVRSVSGCIPQHTDTDKAKNSNGCGDYDEDNI
jgi:hypothetical protein